MFIKIIVVEKWFVGLREFLEFSGTSTSNRKLK